MVSNYLKDVLMSNHRANTLDYTNYTKNVICKRTRYIQTEHHVKFHYFKSCYKKA